MPPHRRASSRRAEGKRDPAPGRRAAAVRRCALARQGPGRVAMSARREAPALDAAATEQRLYARLLATGTRVGSAVLAVGFFAYVTGLLPRTCRSRACPCSGACRRRRISPRPACRRAGAGSPISVMASSRARPDRRPCRLLAGAARRRAGRVPPSRRSRVRGHHARHHRGDAGRGVRHPQPRARRRMMSAVFAGSCSAPSTRSSTSAPSGWRSRWRARRASRSPRWYRW